MNRRFFRPMSFMCHAVILVGVAYPLPVSFDFCLRSNITVWTRLSRHACSHRRRMSFCLLFVCRCVVLCSFSSTVLCRSVFLGIVLFLNSRDLRVGRLLVPQEVGHNSVPGSGCLAPYQLIFFVVPDIH